MCFSGPGILSLTYSFWSLVGLSQAFGFYLQNPLLFFLNIALFLPWGQARDSIQGPLVSDQLDSIPNLGLNPWLQAKVHKQPLYRRLSAPFPISYIILLPYFNPVGIVARVLNIKPSINGISHRIFILTYRIIIQMIIPNLGPIPLKWLVHWRKKIMLHQWMECGVPQIFRPTCFGSVELQFFVRRLKSR